MRKIFTLFLLLIPLWMQAQNGYTWDEGTKILTVTLGEGGYGSYKNQAEHVIIKAGTEETNIEVNAFNAWPALKTAIIEEGVTSIENDVFNGCKQLTSITIPSTMDTIAFRAFYNCTLLEKVEIAMPSNITTIGESAFQHCSSLQSITIPAGIKTIETYAFSDCGGLIEVTISEGVTTIGKAAFNNCYKLAKVTIPESVKSIGEYAFTNCQSLGSVTIPKGVTNIGQYTFINCTSLKSITIPENVTNIGEKAFGGCTALASVTIPGNVTSIGEYAFNSCTSLKSVTIEKGVTSIGEYAFNSCTSLESVTIPESVTSIGKFAFQNCTSLRSITIPGSVKNIEQFTFYGCRSLESITIENGVTNIMHKVFWNCQSLKSVTIPESVTSIGEQAFYKCTALTEVTIPGSVTSIELQTFAYCSALTNIVYKGTKEPEIDSKAFLGISPDATVTVPDIYTGDGFGEFSLSQIKGQAIETTRFEAEHGITTLEKVQTRAAGNIKSGDMVSVVATPDKGYKLESVTVKDKEDNDVKLTDNTFTMPLGGVTVFANFVEDPDWVEPEPEPEPEPEEPEEPVTPDYPDYYNIYVDECEGVTVLTSTNVVREGNSMTFTIEVAEGYTAEDMVVKVKRSLFGYTDVIEPNEEGKYEVRNIYTEIYITIEGVTEEETPTGIEELESTAVYAQEGAIYVRTPQRATVSIVSLTGAIVKKAEQTGTQRYDLPRGIYIVDVAGQRYKVRN